MRLEQIKHNGQIIMISNSEHWDSIFSTTKNAKLGWYEKDATQTLELLKRIPHREGSKIFVVGAGTSILVEQLLSKNVELVINDISIQALNALKARLQHQGDKVHWLCQDISQPFTDVLPGIDIWIDRAVLHFLREEEHIQGYFNNLVSALKPGGHALFAEFSTAGAPKCAGLKLHRYCIEELSARLGSNFKLISFFDHIYINPDGAARPYIYALFKRIA